MNKMSFPALINNVTSLPLYVSSVGHWDHQTEITRGNEFMDYQWIQCVKGSGIVEVDGKVLRIDENEGFLLLPEVPHAYYPLTDGWEVWWLSFAGQTAGEMMGHFKLGQSMKITLTDPQRLIEKMEIMLTELETHHRLDQRVSSEMLYGLLVHLHMDYTQPSYKRNPYLEQLQPVITYINDRYYEPVSLQDLATVLGVTVQHTCLLFQKGLHVRPFEYIARVRIQKAKEKLIQDPTLSVQEVGQQIGYESPSHFGKVFKQHEHMTPATFRKLYRS
ncbi:AraC family transcriptional regulator [Priestia koreensis]|uniref:HTH araC/xylS-type domain-containing protein n=1 Tax=Priestia koreensis TaxID=284581 RepID=A0A0M0L8S3_9BACI|nr:AraC family transcriptional regulator [Priestia koreensis]KOO47476.1 hypothetical protein AMD01_05355 [Priestia koreensis]